MQCSAGFISDMQNPEGVKAAVLDLAQQVRVHAAKPQQKPCGPVAKFWHLHGSGMESKRMDRFASFVPIIMHTRRSGRELSS